MAEVNAIAGEGRKSVVFLPRTATSWSKMAPMVEAIVTETPLRALVVLATADTAALEPALRAQGIDCLAIGPIERQDRGHFPRLARGWRALVERFAFLGRLDPLLRHDRIAHGLPVALLRKPITRRWLQHQRALFIDLLERVKAVALLVPGDRELGPIQPALKAAADLGIPSAVVVPGVPSIPSYSATRRSQARFLTRLASGAPLLNHLAAKRLPGQVADTPDGRLLFTPGWLALALHEEAMLSQNPWCQGGGNSRFIFVSGARAKRVFLDHGVRESKIRIVGDLALDPLHHSHARRDALRRELTMAYRLDAERRLIVFAVPIYAEHDLMTWERHLEALDSIFQVLKLAGGDVLLSLHPRSKRVSYERLARDHGFPIAKQPMAEILPAANLLVCGSSSTIEWAILCGIPTINLDYAGLEDPVWDQYPGVVRVRSADRLSSVLARLTDEPAWYARLAQAQRETAGDFAVFDGCAGKRFLAFLAELDGDSEASEAVQAAAVAL